MVACAGCHYHIAAFVDVGLITDDDKRLVVDHSRVRKAKEKLIKSLNQKCVDLCEEGVISCIVFDGRIDTTKVILKADNSDKQFPSIIIQEHYLFCM